MVRCPLRRATGDERQRFEKLAGDFGLEVQTNDGSRLMPADSAINDLSVVAARNEFAAGAWV